MIHRFFLTVILLSASLVYAEPVKSPVVIVTAKDSSPEPKLKKPLLKVLFDLLLTHRPGLQPATTFDTYHYLLGVEFQPILTTKFSFELSTDPRYFQLEQDLTSNPGTLQLRLGKIWVPFDDLSPHTIYGGRANLAKLVHPDGLPFFPDVFTDLGIALRHRIFLSSELTLVSYLYVVNGFQDLGRDPKDPNVGAYPNFGDIPLEDNNDDKAIGARLHLDYGRAFGVGVSAYRCRYSNRATEAASLFMLGIDGQVRFLGTELRAGYLFVNVNLPSPAPNGFVKGGLYTEWGIPVVERWKLVLRGGEAQQDSRGPDAMDQIILGTAILYKPGPVQFSVQYDRDLHRNDLKRNYELVGARMAVSI